MNSDDDELEKSNFDRLQENINNFVKENDDNPPCRYKNKYLK